MTSVERGAKFLDETFGKGWPRRIKLRSLDLAYSHSCILGQLHFSRDYTLAAQMLGLSFSRRRVLGFAVYNPVLKSCDADTLTRLWKELIRKRLHRKK